ncbi:nuclear factor NF-kappa-B p100 subunit-like [Orbicella faveolata]|uniref:nuclear factor NF-kappa-B p100 subunit-like n=1 Tax=Orbicella faveolata TaxID=48498 RepID=UPI0009E1CBA6|nr:nuclear factor NF-kappa-B p100 subunit-like [Orbicella faveolata]
MDKLDPYVRRKMAQRLDPSIGADWRELAKRLGLGTLESAFAIHSSPTTQVLAQYEAADGSIKTLRQVLRDMRRGDVLEILDGRKSPLSHDSGFDSGLGSQSLSAYRSEELASYEAGSSSVPSSSSLQKGTTSLESTRKAGGYRPIRQHQDVF